MNKISNIWETGNLLIKDSEEVDISDLQAVYSSCSYIGEWTGQKSEDESEYMKNEFEKRHLPPQGKSENHRLQTIRLKEDGRIIGYLVTYSEFPDQDTFWLAVLALHTDYQGKSYGKEVISGLIEEVKKLKKYKQVGLTVGIKNWPALRFWINNGFDRVLKLNGDRIYSDKTFADLWLAKEIWKN